MNTTTVTAVTTTEYPKNTTYDRGTGEVRNAEGHLIGTVKFNGRSGSHGRRWQAITAQGDLIAQAATSRDGIAALTA